MRVPVSWLREFAAVPATESGRDIAARLIRAGLEVETVDVVGGDVTGPVVVGRVQHIEELTEFKKPIRYCQVDVGPQHGGVRGIVCGASNFAAGDLVVVALPGAVLPGDFSIAARQTYGHTSDGMICSERELGLGDNYDGIMVLAPGSAEVGTDGTTVLGIGEEVLDIAVTPDRGYAWSVRGVAREAATAYRLEFADPGVAMDDLPAPDGNEQPSECGSDDLAGCGLFTLRTVVGFDPTAASPGWLRRRLTACGMRSVSLAVDVTNYVMLETGQPIHAYDAAKLRGVVRARNARAGETLTTLDHVDRTLDGHDLVIADDRGPIGLAGVMGGLDTEVDESTSTLAVEAAHFTAPVVAHMSRRHKLSSEASRRYERGVDRVLAPYASARTVALLLRYGGGRYVGMTAVEGPYEPTVVTMPADLPARVAGLPIDGAVVCEHLTAVGCSVEDAAPEETAAASRPDAVLRVTVPSWRPDLTDPADLVEEVIRLVGYDQLPSTLPVGRGSRGLTTDQRLRRRVGLAMAGAGYVEVVSYPFVGTADLDALQLPPDDPRRSVVTLANPLSDERPSLRTTLLPGLFEALRRNVSRGLDDVALVETGLVFAPAVHGGEPPRPDVSGRPDAAELDRLEAILPSQPRHLAVVLTGQRVRQGWWGPAVPAGWADAIQAAREVTAAVGAELSVARGERAPFHPGRCAALTVAGTVVGHAGELHPRVVQAAGLPADTAAMELDLDAVLVAARPIVPAPAVGTMPVGKEDVALVVNETIPTDDVLAALRDGAGSELESLRLFDVYTGDQVGAGKRSLAFRLRFRAADRTLSTAEISAARDAAVAVATERVGAVLRG